MCASPAGNHAIIFWYSFKTKVLVFWRFWATQIRLSFLAILRGCFLSLISSWASAQTALPGSFLVAHPFLPCGYANTGDSETLPLTSKWPRASMVSWRLKQERQGHGYHPP